MEFSEYIYKEFSNNKKCLILAIIWISLNTTMIAGKMKDETGGIVVEEFVKLKPKYTFW